MPRAFLVAGLGFGDEGKGTITEFVTKSVGAKLVVRYNGGCQAAHNVVTPDGRHHCFSQFGSGAFVGASTHLSKHVIVDPLALMKERAALKDKGGCTSITIDGAALLVTQYHRAANRLRELAREDRHGSCGLGIGEARRIALENAEGAPIVSGLKNPGIVLKMLEFMYELYREEFTHYKGERYGEVLSLLRETPRSALDRYREVIYAANTVGSDDGVRIISGGDSDYSRHNGAVVFEGAQGVLLDESFGCHPHNTWTNTTFQNAEQIVGGWRDGQSWETTKIGVIRTQTTRHGAGPLPTEDSELKPLATEHNKRGDWQGSFRVGHLDLVLHEYAAKVTGIDAIAMTHVDMPALKVCTGYDVDGADKAFFTDGKIRIEHPADFAYQEALGKALTRVCPRYEATGIETNVAERLGAPIKILSYGSTVDKKTWL